MSYDTYDELGVTKRFHALPRFGHSNNFAYLFSEQKDQQADYLVGLLFLGIFLLLIYVTATLLVFVAKCLGPSRVGFLSGSAFTNKRRAKRCRIVFIVCGIVLMLFSIVLGTRGLAQLGKSFDTVTYSVREVDYLVGDVQKLTTNVIAIRNSTSPLRDSLVELLNNTFCPVGVQELEAATGVNWTTLTDDAVEFLVGLGDIGEGHLDELQEALDTVKVASTDVQDTASDVQSFSWLAFLLLIPFPLFSILFMVGVLVADRDKKCYQCFLSWLVLPLFSFVVVLCYILAALITFALSVNADFCSGGEEDTPEGSIMDIMEIKGLVDNDLVFKAVNYYVEFCALDDPFGLLEKLEKSLMVTKQALTLFGDAIENVSVEVVSFICRADAAPLIDMLSTIVDDLIYMGDSLQTVLDVLSCERIIPLYTTTVYQGTCKYSISGIQWVFASFLVLASVGLIMIYLRSSYLPFKDVESKGDTASAHSVEDMEVEVVYDPWKQYDDEELSFMTANDEVDEEAPDQLSGDEFLDATSLPEDNGAANRKARPVTLLAVD